jgi:hypothetical protein
MRRGDEEGGGGVSVMNINPLTMENYVLKNNAQKYRSVRTPTDREISLPELTKGVYLYHYSTKNGEINYSGKLIKE